MLNSQETKERLAKLHQYRVFLIEKLQADYWTPQELFMVQDSLVKIDAETARLTEYLEYLQKPISY